MGNPFGNGAGKPAAGPSAGNDFVKNPAGTGGPTAGHNFVKDGQKPPGADGSASGGQNPAKTEMGPQPEGTLRCPDSIPDGGIWPQPQIDKSIQTPQRDLGAPTIAPAHKPFKVSSR
jgi:hypothetical protein